MEHEQDINALVAQAEQELKTDVTEATEAAEVNGEIWEPIPDVYPWKTFITGRA